MAANYRVEFTATAEKDYQSFYDEAQASIQDGELKGYRVSVFDSIDKAIDETLSISPIQSTRCLAGCLSFIFMLNLGPICIYYLAYAEQGIAYILHIGLNQQGADLSWLKEAIANGRADALLKELGIKGMEGSHLLEGTGRDWLN